MKRIDLPEVELRTLYVQNALSLGEVANALGVSRWVVRENLRRLNIKIRPQREYMIRWADTLTAEYLEDAYNVRNLLMREIAEETGASVSTIHTYLRRFDIKCHRRAGRPRGKYRWESNDGYIWVYAPGHPCAYEQGQALEHRLVYWNEHGPIPDGWQVHHINGDKIDNRIENLFALPAKEHALVIPKLQSQIRNLEEAVRALKRAHTSNWPFVGKVEFFAFGKCCELHISEDGEISCPDKQWILEKAYDEYGAHIILELGPGRTTKKLKCLTVGLNASADSLCDIYINLEYGLGFLPDNSVAQIQSNQFLEHLQGLIPHMNECWRVLKPGGLVKACVPHRDSPWAVADPTHKRTFVAESFQYFCINPATGEPFVDTFSDYGVECAFLLEKCEVRPGVDIKAQLRKL